VSAETLVARVSRYWWVTIGLIVADLITKALVHRALGYGESMSIIPGFIDLVHVRNEGVAFGLLNAVDLPYKAVLTSALAVAALLGIVWYARQLQAHERLARLGLACILGGAIGNLLDRVRQGYVLDFVDVYWGNWHFWAFNVADASISIGAVLVFADLLLVKSHVSDPV
jgi:signal peptidase II